MQQKILTYAEIIITIAQLRLQIINLLPNPPFDQKLDKNLSLTPSHTARSEAVNFWVKADFCISTRDFVSATCHQVEPSP